MPSRPTDPTSNHAPQVLDEQIIGNIADKQLELTGTYYDEEETSLMLNSLLFVG